MKKKTTTKFSGNVFQKITRKIVREELNATFPKLESRILTAIDIRNDKLLEAVKKDNYETRSDVAKMKDQIVGELQEARNEMAVLNAQHQRIIDHEERLEKLEEIHPLGQHAVI